MSSSGSALTHMQHCLSQQLCILGVLMYIYQLCMRQREGNTPLALIRCIQNVYIVYEVYYMRQGAEQHTLRSISDGKSSQQRDCQAIVRLSYAPFCFRRAPILCVMCTNIVHNGERESRKLQNRSEVDFLNEHSVCELQVLFCKNTCRRNISFLS